MSNAIGFAMIVFSCLLGYSSTALSQEIYTVGYTTNEWQSHGSLGRQIILEENGRVHFTWTRGFDGQSSQVYYNSYHPDSGWFAGSEGIPVWPHYSCGYADMVMISPGGLHGLRIAYMVLWNSSWNVGVAHWDGFGFMSVLLPGYCFPYIAADRQERVQLVAYTPPPEPGEFGGLYYNRSDDGGLSFEDWQFVDTLSSPAIDMDASSVSDRVGISYLRPIDLSEYMQHNNDNYVVESVDGTSWDFVNDRLNLTRFIETDSFRTYISTTVYYDDNEVRHTAFSTPLYFGQGISTSALIWHHSDLTDSFTVIADGLFDGCGGSWRVNVDQPSFAYDPTSRYLYCAYVVFDTTDMSIGGYSNGEIHISVSTDGGTNWAVGTNVTNSPSPGCFPGECSSDVMPCLAEVVNDTLHLFHILDLDAGAWVFSEGLWFNNEVHYMKIPADMIASEPLIDQSKYRLHRRQSGVQAASEPLPVRFSYLTAYPNPFNSVATISFCVPPSPDGEVALRIYDIQGRLVTVLFNSHEISGLGEVVWDGRSGNGSDVGSGVYFCVLSCEGKILNSAKITLLK